MSKKNKKQEDVDFSGVAKEVFDLIINRLDPISFSHNNIFSRNEWIGCFRGKKQAVCSCRLDKENSGQFYRFMVGLFDSPKKDSYAVIFSYMIPKSLFKPNEEKKLYGHVEVDGFSYRDENYFSFGDKEINKYVQYIKDIECESFIGVAVSAEGASNEESCIPVYYKNKTVKIPDIKKIKNLIKELYYDRHGRDFRSSNVETKR